MCNSTMFLLPVIQQLSFPANVPFSCIVPLTDISYSLHVAFCLGLRVPPHLFSAKLYYFIFYTPLKLYSSSSLFFPQFFSLLLPFFSSSTPFHHFHFSLSFLLSFFLFLKHFHSFLSVSSLFCFLHFFLLSKFFSLCFFAFSFQYLISLISRDKLPVLGSAFSAFSAYRENLTLQKFVS